jgi:hypothetical protein
MDTRIPEKTADIREARSTARVTPSPPKTQFKEVLAQTAVKGAESAMTMLPGGPVMALALRGAPAMPMSTMSGSTSLGSGYSSPTIGSMQKIGTATGTGTAEGPGTSSSSSGAGAVDPLTGQLVSSGDQSGMQSSLQQSQDMNLYYLQIQEEVNAQNRSFTALSNVIKAEHDTVKTAIGNIH